VKLLGPHDPAQVDAAAAMVEWLSSSAGAVPLPGCDVALLHATPVHPRLRPASMAVAASHSLLEALLAAVGACVSAAVSTDTPEVLRTCAVPSRPVPSCRLALSRLGEEQAVTTCLMRRAA